MALGETLFQLERFEEAGVEFERALDLAKDSTVKAEALYNRGTSRLATGETDLAIEDLLASLQMDPEQADARHNLEIGLRRLQQEQEQEQQEQDQQEQGEDEGQEKKDQGDQEQQENQDNQEKNQQQEQEEPEQDEQQADPQEEKEQEQQDQESQENPEEMTQEQALQLLKALDRDEEELKRSVQKRLRGGRPKSGKKW